MKPGKVAYGRGFAEGSMVAPRQLMLDMFHAAVTACMPSTVLLEHLPAAPRGRTIVVGAGKAAAAMAQVVEQHWQGSILGTVVVPTGHAVLCEKIEVVEAAHPVPDDAGLTASRQILAAVSGLTADDLVLCLFSGGGSSLLCRPAEGITLSEKQAVTQDLLRSGAKISEINCVRKHLSAIKGGHLALAVAPARIVNLLISDVPDDEPSTIASGPTLADDTTLEDAQGILDKYGIQCSQAIHAHLSNPDNETPKFDHSAFAYVETHVIATSGGALEKAADIARGAGYDPLILGAGIEGEARDVAKSQAALVQKMVGNNDPVAPPVAIISGGETTVTVKGKGRGGRNSEYLLALGIACEDIDGLYALACDTDGLDGMEENAGAMLTPDSLERGVTIGCDAQTFLDDNDSYGYFSAIGGLVITGPTRTNVNDFRVILLPKQA